MKLWKPHQFDWTIGVDKIEVSLNISVIVNKMSFNSDELQAPEWVNSDFLKKILEYNGDLENVTVRQ